MDVNLLFSLLCVLGVVVSGANQAHREGITVGMPTDTRVNSCLKHNRLLCWGPRPHCDVSICLWRTIMVAETTAGS